MVRKNPIVISFSSGHTTTHYLQIKHIFSKLIFLRRIYFQGAQSITGVWGQIQNTSPIELIGEMQSNLRNNMVMTVNVMLIKITIYIMIFRMCG